MIRHFDGFFIFWTVEVVESLLTELLLMLMNLMVLFTFLHLLLAADDLLSSVCMLSPTDDAEESNNHLMVILFIDFGPKTQNVISKEMFIRGSITSFYSIKTSFTSVMTVSTWYICSRRIILFVVRPFQHVSLISYCQCEPLLNVSPTNLIMLRGQSENVG